MSEKTKKGSSRRAKTAIAAALEEDLCSRADRRHRDKDRRGSERVDRAQIRHAVTRVRISHSSDKAAERNPSP